MGRPIRTHERNMMAYRCPHLGPGAAGFPEDWTIITTSSQDERDTLQRHCAKAKKVTDQSWFSWTFSRKTCLPVVFSLSFLSFFLHLHLQSRFEWKYIWLFHIQWPRELQDPCSFLLYKTYYCLYKFLLPRGICPSFKTTTISSVPKQQSQKVQKKMYLMGWRGVNQLKLRVNNRKGKPNGVGNNEGSASAQTFI